MYREFSKISVGKLTEKKETHTPTGYVSSEQLEIWGKIIGTQQTYMGKVVSRKEWVNRSSAKGQTSTPDKESRG